MAMAMAMAMTMTMTMIMMIIINMAMNSRSSKWQQRVRGPTQTNVIGITLGCSVNLNSKRWMFVESDRQKTDELGLWEIGDGVLYDSG